MGVQLWCLCSVHLFVAIHLLYPPTHLDVVGPAGDGIIWPTSDDEKSHYAPPVAMATPIVVDDAKL